MPWQRVAPTSVGSVGRLVLAALTVWRVTHLITLEDGPLDAVARVRRRLGDGVLGELSDCFACTSIWVAAPVAAALRPPRTSELALSWLGLSGAACLLQRWSEHTTTELRYLDEERSHSHGML
jgi:hypothetical protein